jgi:hypothetical protein
VVGQTAAFSCLVTRAGAIGRHAVGRAARELRQLAVEATTRSGTCATLGAETVHSLQNKS